jgi:hypothetical protein
MGTWQAEKCRSSNLAGVRASGNSSSDGNDQGERHTDKSSITLMSFLSSTSSIIPRHQMHDKVTGGAGSARRRGVVLP